MLYNNFKLGKVLALLDDNGSVTFLSNGFMPCHSEKFRILNDKTQPNNFSAHCNFVLKLFERSKPQLKR